MSETQMIILVAFVYATLPVLCALASLKASHYYERHARGRMAVREAEVLAAEMELGRRAHDVNTMINLHAHAIEDDATVTMLLDWNELEVPD